jgi:hypothetical protein
MPRDGSPIPTPRPMGLGSDVGRLIGAVVLGGALAWFLVRGLQVAVERAILEGWL